MSCAQLAKFKVSRRSIVRKSTWMWVLFAFLPTSGLAWCLCHALFVLYVLQMTVVFALITLCWGLRTLWTCSDHECRTSIIECVVYVSMVVLGPSIARCPFVSFSRMVCLKVKACTNMQMLLMYIHQIHCNWSYNSYNVLVSMRLLVLQELYDCLIFFEALWSFCWLWSVTCLLSLHVVTMVCMWTNLVCTDGAKGIHTNRVILVVFVFPRLFSVSE